MVEIFAVFNSEKNDSMVFRPDRREVIYANWLKVIASPWFS
jgi:hypothetical protein